MKRRYVAGLVVLALAAALAVLIFGGAAGAKTTANNGCPTISRMTPKHGPVGTRVYFYGKGMDKVLSAWMKRKGVDPGDNGLYDARMTKLKHGTGFVSARVPTDASPRIVDADIELDTASRYCFFPDGPYFHIESESTK